MELKEFAAKPANAGEPVTAQAWNELVEGLSRVVSFLEATAGTSLAVVIGNEGIDLAKTRVAAIGADGTVVDASRPIGEGTAFTLRGLAPGAYTIRAESPGFNPAETSVTLPGDEASSLSLEKAAPFMPDVFGEDLDAALAALKTRGIVVSRVVDITGREVPPANPGAEFGSTLILAQLPDAAEPVPASETAQLVVSASLEIEPTVEMPSLSGLTLTETRRVLEGLGLVLGKVQTTRI